MLRSWYVFVFQLPGIPEALLAANDMKALRGAMVDHSNPGTFQSEDIELSMQAWREHGALKAMAGTTTIEEVVRIATAAVE